MGPPTRLRRTRMTCYTLRVALKLIAMRVRIETLGKLDEMARQAGITRSEVIRTALDAAVGKAYDSLQPAAGTHQGTGSDAPQADGQVERGSSSPALPVPKPSDDDDFDQLLREIES